MMCLDYGVEIQEGLEQLQTLYRRQGRSLARRRLRFLILLKSGACTSQTQAGARIGIKQRASEKLWALYRTGGVAGLLQKPRSGRRPKLDPAAQKALDRELDSDSIQTLKQACGFVLHHNGIAISQSAMHKHFKAQGIKKKTGRPAHVQKDTRGEERFKKKSFPA